MKHPAPGDLALNLALATLCFYGPNPDDRLGMGGCMFYDCTDGSCFFLECNCKSQVLQTHHWKQDFQKCPYLVHKGMVWSEGHCTKQKKTKKTIDPPNLGMRNRMSIWSGLW